MRGDGNCWNGRGLRARSSRGRLRQRVSVRHCSRAAAPALSGGEEAIYLGTVSKTLSPLLRLGYLVIPPLLRDVVATAKQLVDRHAPTTEQEALATLIESGAYEGHVRRVRRLNGARRAALLRALERAFGDRAVVEGADAGLHVVAWFRDLPRESEGAVIDAAGRAGVGLPPVSSLYDAAADGGSAGSRRTCDGLFPR